MHCQSYYDLLEIADTASPAEIKSAFRRLAMQWHPDRNHDPEAPARFREIDEAYRCLIDPRAREVYDATRRGGAAHAGAQSRRKESRDGFCLAELWANIEAAFITPERLAACFARVDAWLQRAWAKRFHVS